MTRFVLPLLLLASLAPAAPVPKPVLTEAQEAEFNVLWDKVGASDYSYPAHLYCRLIQEPDAGVAYLSKTLKPAKMDAKEAKQLIADLDNKEVAVWRAAYRTLRVRDFRLALRLTDGWDEAKSDNQKWRLGSALAGGWKLDEDRNGITLGLEPPSRREKEWSLYKRYDGGGGNGYRITESFPAKEYARTSVVVAAAALERINTPAARKHLEALAEGHEEAGSTREATAALSRLKKDAVRTDVKFDDLWRGHYAYLADLKTVTALLDRPKEAVALFKKHIRPVKLDADGAKKLLAELFSDDAKQVRAALRELMVIDLRLEMDFHDIWKEAKTATHRGRLAEAMWLWSTNTHPTYGEIADDLDIDERNKYFDYRLEGSTGAGKRFAGWGVRSVWRADIDPKNPPKGAGQGHSYGIDTDKGVIHPQRWIREEVAIAILDAIGTDDALAIIKDMATGHADAGPTKAAKEVLKRRGVK